MSIKVQIKTTSGKTIVTTIQGTVATIGRSPYCEIPVQEESLSRKHCLIELNDGVISVTDLQSQNGVYIDGNRIPPNVKTEFPVFKQLTLGALECTIEEVESLFENGSAAVNKSNLQPASDPNSEKQTKIGLNKPPTSKPRKPSTTSAKSEKTSLIQFILPILILAAAAYYVVNDKRNHEEDISIQPDISPKEIKNQPPVKPLMVAAENEFKPDGVYIESKSKADCFNFEDLCKTLSLDKSFSEGIVKDEDEVIVYFNSDHLLKNEKNAIIKSEENILSLLIFKQLLPSSLIEQYYENKISQIHVVLLNESGKVKQVLRIHPNQFNPEKNPRTNLLSSLSKALTNQGTQDFFDEIDKLIVKKDITE